MPTDSNASNDALVSIICRTTGRTLLDDALSSIAAQTYPNIEVILVNAGTNDLQQLIEKHDSLQLKVVGGESNLSRADAANLGLESAEGFYLMFLDDDDWVSDSHVSSLVSQLQDQSSVKAVYSCTQKTLADGSLTDEIFRQPYDAALLLRDNFMPIHSVIFERTLIDTGCRFDSAFNILEDWDFWLQLSQHTDFLFVDQISAFYRAGGDSETGQEDISVRYQPDHVLGKARAKLFDKWLSKWSGSEINKMLGSMDQATLISSLQQSIKERDDKLQSEHEINLKHQAQIGNLLKEAESDREKIDRLQHSLKDAEKTTIDQGQHIAHLDQHIENLNSHSQNLEEEVSRLNSNLSEITNSVWWRLAAPLRFLRRRARNKNSSHSADKDI